MGIIEGNCIRATNIKFLNDTEEFRLALDRIRTRISQTEIDGSLASDENRTSFRNDLLDVLQQFDGDEELESKNRKSESMFTLSFTEQTDLLSQWRGYCPPDDGYCIVFDVAKVCAAAKMQFGAEAVAFEQCIYDDAHDGPRIEKAFKVLLSQGWSNYLTSTTKDHRASVIEDFSRKLMFLAAQIKHSAFREEKEWRLIVLLPDKSTSDGESCRPHYPHVRFRQGNVGVIPYVEISGNIRSSIDKIFVGPSSHMTLKKRGLFSFLENYYGTRWLSVVGTEDSKIPYRSF